MDTHPVLAMAGRVVDLMFGSRGAARAAARGSPLTTTQLIDGLTADLRPTAPTGMAVRLAGAAVSGAVVSALILGAMLGIRTVPGTLHVYEALAIKLIFATSMLFLALWAAECLSRPGEDTRARWRWLAAPVIGISAVAVGQLLGASDTTRAGLMLGDSATTCTAWIAVGSLPPMVALIRVMRGQAPTRPWLAGAVVGAGAGATSAAVYALHCVETAIPFIGVWYSLGIIVAATIGAVAGSRLLRW